MKKILSILTLTIYCAMVFAQAGVTTITRQSGSVGQSLIAGANATPAASSILEARSTTKGFLAPRMTTVQRDAIGTPATGLLIYNTTTNNLNVYYSAAWHEVNSDIAAANGLTYSNDTVKLGGTSTENTTINKRGFLLQHIDSNTNHFIKQFMGVNGESRIAGMQGNSDITGKNGYLWLEVDSVTGELSITASLLDSNNYVTGISISEIGTRIKIAPDQTTEILDANNNQVFVYTEADSSTRIGLDTTDRDGNTYIRGDKTFVSSLGGNGTGVVGFTNDGELVESDVTVTSGKYLPDTLSTQGVDVALSMDSAFYSRVGNVVIISGKLSLTGNGAEDLIIGLNMPINTSDNTCTGTYVAYDGIDPISGRVESGVPANSFNLSGTTLSAQVYEIYYTVTYLVR